MAATFASHPISLAAAPPSFSGPSPLYVTSVRTYRSPGFRCSSTNFAFRLVPVAREHLRVRCAASDPKMTEGVEDGQLGQNESGDVAYRSLSMLALIKSYKEAIINGDEKHIPSLEAAICNIDKEKADLLNKATEISAEIASAKDKFLRFNADFENFRKRSDKDRLKFSSDIQREVIESLLPLVDNFEKAKQQIVPETEKEQKISTSYQGIYKQFVEIMRAFRVSVVETVGKQFDPLFGNGRRCIGFNPWTTCRTGVRLERPMVAPRVPGGRDWTFCPTLGHIQRARNEKNLPGGIRFDSDKVLGNYRALVSMWSDM